MCCCFLVAAFRALLWLDGWRGAFLDQLEAYASTFAKAEAEIGEHLLAVHLKERTRIGRWVFTNNI